jgi:asparagine synthase (glutamine-hydrolysing)
MCGIAGFAGTGNLEDLRRMTEAVKHRGPDGDGQWHEGSVFLGHRRLAILDLEGGAQPMHSHDGRFVTVLNGEIYNYIELREELISAGTVFRTDHSDTEVFMEAYRHWGTAFHSHLNGMWAAAIYDRKERALFLTRDRFGKKPLYYTQKDGCFAFASELRALCQHQHVEARISPQAVQKYLAHGYVPAPTTIYSGVSKLEAGCWLLLNTETMEARSQTYWRFQLSPATGVDLKDAPQAAAEILERIKDATFLRLRADVPVGVFLSGGIDSTTVATLAASATTKLASFSIGFEEKSFDETPYALDVARRLNLDHEHRQISVNKCRDLLPEILARLDEPLGDPSLIPTFLLCKMASQRVKVCLSGDGADELFAGYDPFRALRPALLYHRIVPGWLHRFLRRGAGLLPVSFDNMSLDFRAQRTLRGLSYPKELWNSIWMAPADLPEIRRLTGSGELSDIFAEDLRSQHRGEKLGPVDQMLLYFTDLYLREDILTKVDRASMMNSLEVRCPFLDSNLVDYVRKLPVEFKLRGSTTKWILKQAIKKLVPAHIVHRKKKGFGMPIAKWFYDGSLTCDLESLSSVVDSGVVKKLTAQHRQKRANHAWTLWCLFVLGLWIKEQGQPAAAAKPEVC